MTRKYFLWGAFFVFAVCAIGFGWHEDMFSLNTRLSSGKYIVWVVFLAFLGYSLYCSSRENLFKSIRKMAELHWGRQVGIDLYLGLFLMLFIVYLNEGSILAVALWLLPTLAFGNLATLLYLAIHFDGLVARFLAN